MHSRHKGTTRPTGWHAPPVLASNSSIPSPRHERRTITHRPGRAVGRKSGFGHVPAAIDQRPQCRVERDALVEHEAAALVTEAANLLEIPEDAPVELQHVVHAL